MIKNTINKMKSPKGCITFSKTTEEDLDNANSFFHQNHFCPIPAEYETFLNITNGLIYNGVEFFGTTYHYRKEKDYYFPDIMTINKHYKKYSFFEEKIIIGRLSESMIIYDRKSDTYAIIDRVKLRSRTEYETLNELLEYLIKAYYPTE